MSLNASRSLLVRTIDWVYRSVLSSVRCRLPVEETRLIHRVALRICAVSSYCLPLPRWSGREKVHINSSWPSLEFFPLVRLLWFVVQPTEPVLPSAPLLREFLYCEYSCSDPPALGVLSRRKKNGISLFEIGGSSSLKMTNLHVYYYEHGYL